MDQTELGRRAFLKATAAGGFAAALGEFGGNIGRPAERAGEIPMRALGNTGLRVSVIGLGGFHMGLREKEEDSIALVHRALDLGINFFDNADSYMEGRAEERMGKALVGRRQKIILMSKVESRDAKGAREALEASLRRLRTDYLDIWQFHAVTRRESLNQILGPGGAMETAQRAKQEGKIRFIGITSHANPEVLLEAIKRYPFDVAQMPINVVDPHFMSFRRTVVDEAVKRNVGVIAMKPLGRGNIVSLGVATASEAFAWLWSQPVSVAVTGCEWLDALDYNVSLAKTLKPMPDGQQAALLARTKPRAGTGIEIYKDWV
jgi:aryl-alcohol dehydrogenase-like predicted oxidoreductase